MAIFFGSLAEFPDESFFFSVSYKSHTYNQLTHTGRVVQLSGSTWNLGTGEDDAVHLHSLLGGGEVVSAGGETKRWRDERNRCGRLQGAVQDFSGFIFCVAGDRRHAGQTNEF